MRKIVLSIIATLFITPAFAEEKECAEPAQPRDIFIEVVAQAYPNLDANQAASVASMYELAYHQDQLANDEAVTSQERQFAERTKQVAMRMAAIQLQVFDSRPQMQSVIERMDAEAAAGLERVSPKLEPDVRHAMSTMAVIGLAWGDLSTDIIQLGAERFLARADAGNITDESDQAKCTLKTAMDVLGGVADFFPGAVTLATVERLNY